MEKPEEIYTHSINAPWFNISKKTNETIIYSLKKDSVVLKYEFKTNKKTLTNYLTVKDKRTISDEYYEMIYAFDAEIKFANLYNT